MTPELERAVRRNTLALAACLAVIWAVLQLTISLASITMEALTGRPELVGIAPALVVLAIGAATVPAGRFMDRRGRAPGVALGFLGALAGALVTYVAVLIAQPLLFLAGLALIGAGAGVVNLARAAAADMFPPERRGGGVGLVLVGAAVGALAAPFLFGPLLRLPGRDALLVPWLAAAALLGVGWLLTLLIRVDPLEIARAMGKPPAAPLASATPVAPPAPTGSRTLAEIFARPATRAAAVTIVGAQVVMAAVMSLAGVEMHHRGHDLTEVSFALAAHFVGMFGLAPVIGRIVDRTGRRASLLVGLLVLGAAVVSLLYATELPALTAGMLALGVGWNIAFVAGTVLLADATEPGERGRALGAVDLGNALGSAAAAAALGAVLGAIGFTAVAAIALALLVGPLLFVLSGMRAAPRSEAAAA